MDIHEMIESEDETIDEDVTEGLIRWFEDNPELPNVPLPQMELDDLCELAKQCGVDQMVIVGRSLLLLVL